tara:strand:+ start:993 stop:1226 length:234 start_codon:yes stop_codon:yes gene_type:complete
MKGDRIKEILLSGLGDCDIEIEIDGNKVVLNLVSIVFEGLSRVRRQQKVYALLNGMIASGEIHAITMRTQTPDEISG